jgi:hypothetical protein
MFHIRFRNSGPLLITLQGMLTPNSRCCRNCCGCCHRMYSACSRSQYHRRMGACILLVLDAAYVAAAAEGGSNAVSACHCRQGLASSLRLAPHAGLAAACPPAGGQAAARRRHLLLCRRGCVEVVGSPVPLGGYMAESPPFSFLTPSNPSLTLTPHFPPYPCSPVLSLSMVSVGAYPVLIPVHTQPSCSAETHQPGAALGEPGRCGRLPAGLHTLSALAQRARRCYQMWKPLLLHLLSSLPTFVLLSCLTTRGTS